MNNDIWKGFMKEVNTYLKNPNDKAKEESFNKIQKIVEEQKRIILTLDSKDIEHVYLYSSKKWNEFYKLSINEIISNPKDYWKTVEELKLNTVDRNYPIFSKALKAKEDIKSIFGIKKLNNEKNFFATIKDYTTTRHSKFFGIIDKEKIDSINKLIELRDKVKDIYSINAADDFIDYLERIQTRSEYESIVNLVNNLQNETNRIQQNKLTFSNRCEYQIKQSLNNDETVKSTDELQLSLYMMIFSKYFDDQNPIEISENDLERIIKKVWVPYDDSTEVGKIYMNQEKFQEFSNIFYNSTNGKKVLREEQTKWVLSQIRNGIAHGSFEIIEEDGKKLINIIGKEFKSEFKFDCIIDICDELLKANPNKSIPYDIEKLLTSIKNVDVKSVNELLTSNKLNLFDLYINSIVTYNEDFIHKKKDFAFNGLPEITAEMKTDDYIGWVRNAVVHNHRELDSSGNIVIKDGSKEDKSVIEEKTKINFSSFLNFVNRRNLVETMKNNLQKEDQRMH